MFALQLQLDIIAVTLLFLTKSIDQWLFQDLCWRINYRVRQMGDFLEIGLLLLIRGGTETLVSGLQSWSNFYYCHWFYFLINKCARTKYHIGSMGKLTLEDQTSLLESYPNTFTRLSKAKYKVLEITYRN